MYYDPTKIRPRRDWVTVLQEPRCDYVGGIFMPVETGVEKVTEGTGVVIRVGGGKKIDNLCLKAGDRIVYRTYLKYANPIPAGLTWPDGKVKQHFLMSVDDIFAIVPEGLNIGVFSKPSGTNI